MSEHSKHLLSNPFRDKVADTSKEATTKAIGVALGLEKANMFAALLAMEKGEEKLEEPEMSEETKARLRKIQEEHKNYEEEKRKQEREHSPEGRREAFNVWALSIGKNEKWVNDTFEFNLDGTVVVEGDLDLMYLTTLKDFPSGLTEVKEDLNLHRLTSLEGITLPNIGGDLDLDSVTSLENVTFSDIGGDLYLNSLTSLEGVTLPNIGGDLYLESLTSLKLSDFDSAEVKGVIYLNKNFNTDKLKELNNNDRGLRFKRLIY